MQALAELFGHRLAFDPGEGLEAFLARAPGRGAVYLLTDADDRPVQLLSVRNLRASLLRRLGTPDGEAGPSRRVNYQGVVRAVWYNRVDSHLEADLEYLRLARRLFPDTWRTLLAHRPAHFVHIDPGAAFPRYVKSTMIGGEPGLYVGPVEDKHAAERLIQLLEDTFDLCRYYNVLLQSPHGRACAYKEMGRCPAPCDGTVSMDVYLRGIRESVEALVDPEALERRLTERMRDAAGGLRFEEAARHKARLDQLELLHKGPFRFARPLEELRFVACLPGPWAKTAKLLLIDRGAVLPLVSLRSAAPDWSRLAREAQMLVEEEDMAEPDADALGILAAHLFRPRAAAPLLLRLPLSGDDLRKAHAALAKRKEEPLEESEGLMQALEA